MKTFRKLIAGLLCCLMVLSVMPFEAFAQEKTEETETAFFMDNGYINVSVSKANGGFTIGTNEGDSLKKSDNNKTLLYHDGLYDTSFLSFHVEYEDGGTKEYLFGGKYADSTSVAVLQPQAGGEIAAVWSVGDLTFTQTVSLLNTENAQHGMVSIHVNAVNNGSRAASVKARLLLDTALGAQDYAVYQMSDGTKTGNITAEKIVSGGEVSYFTAVDDPAMPSVTAYVVNNSGIEPYQAAFGHWNNLASTLFAFAPDGDMNFTSAVNRYLTADSACAVYYDLGSIAGGAAGAFGTCYGVYAHSDVSLEQSVTIDAVAPLRLDLNADKTAFVRRSSTGIADFSVDAVIENYISESSADRNNVFLTVRTTSGLRSLSDQGTVITGLDYDTIDPMEITYAKLANGQKIEKTLYFGAKLSEEATYERITIAVYEGEVASNKQLGERTLYILLPGSDGSVPRVSITAMSPKTVYSSGTRHLFIAVTNSNLLSGYASLWNMTCHSADGKTNITIPHSSLSVSDGTIDVALTDDIRLPVGVYTLSIDWDPAAIDADLTKETTLTSPELTFTVSDDVKYKNESYGILAVVKHGNIKTENRDNLRYTIESFRDEADFRDFKNKTGAYKNVSYAEILMIYRGEFTADRRYFASDENGRHYLYYSGISKKSVDPDTRKTTVDNPITINGCLDFEGRTEKPGTIAIYYEDYETRNTNSAILCEMDGELYTSDARTSVWKGKAALTKIVQKSDFGLIPYDQNGVRGSTTATPITLIWPNIFGTAQSLLGLAFKMAFAQFGVMKNGSAELGRVVSFSASLDLSFTGSRPDGAAEKDTYFSKMKDLWEFWHEDTCSLYQYAYNTGHVNKLLDFSTVDESPDEDTPKVSASVLVQDILFGCGEGFVGVHFKVGVGVKNYVENLPNISGTLEVNTINDWSFALNGSMKIFKAALEAKLSFKSKDNIPVPDEIFFSVSGFKPGWNVDGTGVLWIKGGGGGISHLYDTIFMTQSVPPLRLCIAASFSIAQVVDGQAKIEFGATGIKLQASKLKIFDEIDFIKNILLSLDWYPGLDLKAAINVDLFQGIISGQGYIALVGKNYTDWFFEMMIQAALKIPRSVPVVGGMSLFDVILGGNTERIWGAVSVIGIGVGISYYWGDDDVYFGSNKNIAEPTYPGLLKFGADEEDIPIYYDEENDRTLYARVGTNFSAPVTAQVMTPGALRLFGSSGIWSTADFMSHKFNLGTYGGDNTAVVVQLNYRADSLAEAEQIGKTIAGAVKDASGKTMPLTVYDAAKDNLAASNANISYNGETKTAVLAFTVTDPADFDRDWTVSTAGTPAEIMFCQVYALPTVESVSLTVKDGTAAVTWTGTELDSLDHVNFFLDDGSDPQSPGYFLAGTDVDLASGTMTCSVPAGIPTGDYVLRANYASDGETFGSVISKETVHIENPHAPGAVTAAAVRPSGDLKYEVTIPAPAAADPVSDYLVSVYTADGAVAGAADQSFARAKDGDTVISVGGRYVTVDENGDESEVGLIGGTGYILGITPVTCLDTDGDGENDTAVYGDEYRTAPVYLPVPTTPKITFTPDITPEFIPYTYISGSINGVPAETAGERITFTAADIGFRITGTEAVSGTWELDRNTAWDPEDPAAVSGTFADTDTITVALKALTDGDHILTLTGKDADGDAFTASYAFTVDTTAPRLILSSPVNGAFFGKDGSLAITGITDTDALLSVSIDGIMTVGGKTVGELGGAIDPDGVFSVTVQIPDAASATAHHVSITAADAVGNQTGRSVTVRHGGLTDLADMKILVNGASPADGNIAARADAAVTKELSLLGVMSDGSTFVLDSDCVTWYTLAARGTSTVTPDGILTVSANAQGFAEARLQVAANAFRTADVTFGGAAESYVSVSHTPGGSVTGEGGYHTSGDVVTLTAEPEDGYVFDGWTVTGAPCTDPAKAVIQITVGTESVTAAAKFRAKSYGITVDDIAFPDVVYGYAKPGSKTIVITGTTQDDAAVSSVTVSGDAFTVAGSGTVVPGGGALKTWSIRPAEGLFAGSYQEKLTVTYNGGAVSEAYVTMTVLPVQTPITVRADDGQKVYDGTPLQADGYTYTNKILLPGDTLQAVVSGSITDAGSGKSTVSSFTVSRADGTDVTGCYRFTDCEDGILTVLPAVISDITVKQTGSLTYTGSAQTAYLTVQASTAAGQPLTVLWSTSENGTYSETVPAFTAAGGHTVFFRLSAPNHTTSAGSTAIRIMKAENAVRGLSLSGWTYGAEPKTPAAEADFGEIVYTYAPTEDGPFTEAVPADVGMWWVKASVPEGDHWKAAEATACFTITAASMDVKAAGYQGVYDGKPHGITVTAPDDAEITYTVDGRETTGSPLFTDAGDYTVNYKVTRRGAEEIFGSAHVTITKAKYDMSSAAWDHTDAFIYDGTEKSVTVTGLPAGVTASYTGNTAKEIGVYTAKALFAFDSVNYETPSIADCVWEIREPQKAAEPEHMLLTFETGRGSAVPAVTALEGGTVDLTAYRSTRSGYDFCGWYADPACTVPADTVVMDADHTVYAKWKIQNPFEDVREGRDWFCEDVMYVYEAGMMNGTAAHRFSPAMMTDRAMIVTVLYRLEGSPDTGDAASFTDITPGSWYADAVGWASACGIVKGYPGGAFGPADPLTREQLAVILKRYADHKGCRYDAEAAANCDLSGYRDADDISSYALDAVKWANACGILNGTDDKRLNPGGSASRAELAAILHRFCELLKK